MRLFFLRHGEAENGGGHLADFDRALTDKGRAELEWVARGLRRLNVTPNIVLSSPLVRARQTAEIVAPILECKLELVDDVRSGAAPQAFLRLAQDRHEHAALMFVGHEPDLSEAAGAFLGASRAEIVLKKAGLIRIDLHRWIELGHGRLRWLLTPGQLAAIGGAPHDDALANAYDER